MKKLLCITLLAAGLYACSNNDDEEPVYTYPATLVSQDYRVTTPVRLYTKYGQITNQAVIDNYRQNEALGYFYWDDYSSVSLPINGSVTYQDKDTIMLEYPGPFEKRVVKNENGYNYFCYTDTLMLSKQSNSPLLEITRQIGVYKPYYGNLIYTPDYENVYDADVATGNPDKLEFCKLIYKLTRSANGSQSMIAYKNYNNAFDINVLNLLQDGDTLAVQEAKITYVKP